jgi:hypothetical protein
VQQVFTSIRYLARQGLALRGHEEMEGYLMQLLRLRSEDSKVLSQWLHRTTNVLSHESQNEILDIFGNSVQRQIVKNVTETSKLFGIIVDGTQDCSGTEQEAVCIR